MTWKELECSVSRTTRKRAGAEKRVLFSHSPYFSGTKVPANTVAANLACQYKLERQAYKEALR